ncbi:MAG: adenylate/guanylate cyclase domain-containing protein, partial [Spirochaetia bacterium]
TVISFKNDKMAFHLKKRLSAIAKPILFEENMNFYKSTGDGFLATFSGPLQALDVAQKILQALKKRNGTTDNPPIQVRIGLHFGKTYIIDPVTDDIHGYDINLTFRLEGLKKAAFSKFFVKLPQVNRILATRSFYDQIDNRSKRKREDFRLIGPAKLKGVDEKIDIFDVAWDK